MTPRLLVAGSAAIIGLLGAGHLLLTLRGPKLLPRDRSLVEEMARVSPVITGRTTIWKMWMGFNVSHSMGALLFGLTYGYLALVRADVLFQSPFLQVVGLAMLGGFVILARAYWFVTPLAGSAVSLTLYVLGLVMARAG